MATSKFAASLERQTARLSPEFGSLQVAKAIYNFATDGGAASLITPRVTTGLPKNAIIVGGTVNSTTAFTSAGAATLSVGTSAGSSATSILGVTAKGSLSLNAVINAVPTFAGPVKLSAAGNVTVTIGTTTATAGVVEITLFYFVANA